MLLDNNDFEKVFKNVVATNDGRKLVSHIISLCGCDEFNPISENKRRDDFNIGKRYIGGVLLNAFKEYSLTDYIIAIKEDYNKKILEELKNERKNEDE